MTRNKVYRRQDETNEPFAFVLYDESNITEIVCTECVQPEDVNDVGIFTEYTVVCDRCGNVV